MQVFSGADHAVRLDERYLKENDLLGRDLLPANADVQAVIVDFGH